jgi:hypothetical protein
MAACVESAAEIFGNLYFRVLCDFKRLRANQNRCRPMRRRAGAARGGANGGKGEGPVGAFVVAEPDVAGRLGERMHWGFHS